MVSKHAYPWPWRGTLPLLCFTVSMPALCSGKKHYFYLPMLFVAHVWKGSPEEKVNQCFACKTCRSLRNHKVLSLGRTYGDIVWRPQFTLTIAIWADHFSNRELKMETYLKNEKRRIELCASINTIIISSSI